MKTKIFNLLITGLISGLVFTSCSKSEITEMSANTSAKAPANANTASTNNAGKPSPTTASILNQDLRIAFASDNGTDISQQFRDFTFRFVGTYPGGEAQVWNDLLAQLGSWSSATESTDFTIAYPTNIFQQFTFLNRQWNIAASTTSYYRLESADGDRVDFVSRVK